MVTTANVLTCLCLLVLKDSLSVSAKIESLFGFGDSNLDTGNVFTLSGTPGFPYGQTYPKYSTGRFSDGVNLFDTLSDYLGLWPPPPPAFAVNVSAPLPKNGINFAIGGAGAFKSISGPWQDLSKQVDYFSSSSGIMKYNFSNSLFYISIGANDYEVLRNGTATTKPLMKKLAPVVIIAMWKQMKRLYDLGARNFAILKLHPVECQPVSVEGGGNPNKCLPTKFTNFAIHNNLLKQLQARLAKLKNTKVVILDLYKASLKILDNPKCFGMETKTRYSACCTGPPGMLSTCGTYDETTKKPLFTVCKSPKAFFWWDADHFSQAAAKALSGLFFYGKGYASPGGSLCKGLRIPCPKPNPKSRRPAAIPYSSYCVSKR